MRIKYLKSSVASLSILSGLFCFTGCQDDGVLKEVGIEEYVPQGTNDVAGSVLIHIIEEGDENSLVLPLSVLRMVDIETAQTITLNSTASNAMTASGVPLPKYRKHSTSHLRSFR